MIGSELLSNLMILVQMALYWLSLKWFIANLASNGQPLGSVSPARVWAYLGWTSLAVISVITIVGWAWVYVPGCDGSAGISRARGGKSSSSAAAWSCCGVRSWLRSASIFIIPDTVGISMDAQWLASQIPLRPTPEAARRGFAWQSAIAPCPLHLRWRTEPSWATDATSVPSGLKIRPRVNPRPSCALGESCA